MKEKNDRKFELRLGKKALIFFVLGISLFLFVVFLFGVRIGKIMDAHPETVAMGLPYVVMECFGWTPKKVDPDVAVSEAPKELAPEEENKPDLTFYDTLANKKKDTKIAEKVIPEKSPPAVNEKPSQKTNTEATTKNTVSSRVSTNFLTKGRWERAVTFQSIVRISSPGTYSRTSENSIPCPLKTDSYSPPKRSLTSRVVRISIFRTFFRRAARIITPPKNFQDPMTSWARLNSGA